MGAMMRSGVLLALLILTLMVSQASDLPFSPSSDAPAGLAARSASKEGKAVVSQASDLLSPSTSDAPAGLAAGSASKEGEAVVPPASDLPVPSPWSADASGPAAAETVSKKKQEAADEGEPVVVIGGPTEKRDRLVLIFANALSLISSIFPFVIRWGYGSWYITMAIFPAKGVACGLIASGAWTVYVILEMYAENKYAGQEALMVNCLTMGINLVTLFIYFLHGGENKKFWNSLVVFLTMALGGLVWLVWHPNIIHSDRRKTIFKDTQVFGVIGMALFAIMNIIPFADLWAMTIGGRNDFFTLLVPIMMNTFLSSIANCFWTIYAWLFAPRHPNYFMYANCMATVMTFVQAIWLSILRIKHKEVEGLITEVESLRSVLISVSSSLGRLGAAPDADGVWNKNNFLIRLQESLKTGVQSLVLMEITFRKLEADLLEKTNAAAVAAGAPEAIGNRGMAENAAAVETSAIGALARYPTLFAACRGITDALEAIERALRDKLSDAQGRAEGEGLKPAVQNASEAVGTFAASLRPCMQVINASQGIPPAVQFAFDYCREKMFIIKTAVDSEFLIH